MLLQLSIHHLALIDEISIDFAPGMNVLTGETGAGKSIVVDAVNLVLGERADRDLIANGKQKARVEAVFDIADNEKVKALLEELSLEGSSAWVSVTPNCAATCSAASRLSPVSITSRCTPCCFRAVRASAAPGFTASAISIQPRYAFSVATCTTVPADSAFAA